MPLQDEELDVVEGSLPNQDGTPRSLDQLLSLFLHVKRCWNNHDLCLKENMTFERAANALREIRDESRGRPGGTRLSEMAHSLLWEIVNKTENNEAVEQAMMLEEEIKKHPSLRLVN